MVVFISLAALFIAGAGLLALRKWPEQIVGAILRLLLRKKSGNSNEYLPGYVDRDPGSLLQGKKIIFLGSSVTFGFASLGNSFVEYLAARDGVIPVKEAVNGTTLVTLDSKSYIPRMEKLDKSIRADAFVCQLSTNDAKRDATLGTVSDSFERSSFDQNTVAGAIEYIISYASETWKCPVLFYSGTRYISETYAQMVDLLLQIREKWGITVIDLWNDDDLNDISDELRALYILQDGVHPTMAGYRDWWLPKFEEALEETLR